MKRYRPDMFLLWLTVRCRPPTPSCPSSTSSTSSTSTFPRADKVRTSAEPESQFVLAVRTPELRVRLLAL